MRAADAVAELRRLGCKVVFEGETIRVGFRPDLAVRVRPILADLRSAKQELLAAHRAGKQPHWPTASLETEAKFGHPSARLYPFLGRRVWTPRGLGKLVQGFRYRAGVVLDDEPQRLSFFDPSDILPERVM